jgi:hypothetical protein
MHRSEVYSVGMGPKGPALSRFPVIKKKNLSDKDIQVQREYNDKYENNN